MKTKLRYSYPVEMSGAIKMLYDESPAHVRELRHAVDFVVPEGTPVLAAADGIVIDLKSDSSIGGEEQRYDPLGNFIELEHRFGEYSEYEHLQQGGVVVRVGERVRKGQVIGCSGTTGWIAHLGSHLHFMVGRYGASDEEYETLEINWADKVSV